MKTYTLCDLKPEPFNEKDILRSSLGIASKKWMTQIPATSYTTSGYLQYLSTACKENSTWISENNP